MNLTITQNNGITETINSSIIDKLYEIAFAASSDPNSTVSLTGRLESRKGYKYKMDWLNTEFGPDLTITVPTSGLYIYFEDDAVLSALVSAGVSSDGVGISADDLLVPTNLSQLGLSGNSNISSFTELSKFVNIRNNSTNFDGCTNLEWISLPNNDGNLNISFFIPGGKKLKWVVPSVEFACSKEFNSWYNNPARGGGADTAWLLYDLNKQPITDVIIPEGVTCIGKYVFGKMSCNSLSIPSTITQIRQNAFENVSVTQGFSLNLPNITSIGSSGFLGCTNLTGTLSFPNLTSIGNRAFYNCTGITSLDFTGSTFTSVSNEVFRNCSNLSKIKLPTTVTALYEGWGRGINNTLYICGLDNISTHSTNSWTLTNTTIINPIKTSIITDSNIVDWSDNRLTVRLHSIYEPLRTSTVRTSQVVNGQPKSSHFVYNCLGGSGSFTIGLLYYRDITSFGDATFFRCNIENLVINNITPPTLNNSDTTFSGEYYWQNWGNSIFGNLNASSDAFLHDHAIIGTLWVPDSAVATYQADPQYSSLTIKGINTKTNGTDYDLPRYADFAAWEAAEEAAVAQGGHAPQGLIEAWM